MIENSGVAHNLTILDIEYIQQLLLARDKFDEYLNQEFKTRFQVCAPTMRGSDWVFDCCLIKRVR